MAGTRTTNESDDESNKEATATPNTQKTKNIRQKCDTHPYLKKHMPRRLHSADR